jgi:hypothetical protein
VAPGSDVVVITGGCGCGLTVTVSDAVAFCELASVTRIVNVLVPLPVGVPEMTPELIPSVKPAGKFPDAIDQEYGAVPPVADTVAL